MRTLPAQLLAALRALVVLTVLLGVLYPLVVLGIGQLAFRENANGSLLEVDGRVVGSDLLGQSFTDPATGEALPEFFQPRASNAGDGYDPTATAASNLGPEDEGLLAEVGARREAVIDANGLPAGADVPPDALTASGSGLDPHISPEHARLQAARVAEARGLDVAEVEALVEEHVQGRVLGFLGEPRVNVLRLNAALEGLG